MYYGYGYNYRALSALPVLLLIALVTTIVLTVMLYKRYVSTSKKKLIDFQDPRSIAAFLRFDTLLIERILKVLYLFNAIGIPVFGLAITLGVSLVDFQSGLITLLSMIIGTLVGEILVRLLYEGIMLRVLIARNTSAIKRALGVVEEADDDGISNFTPAPVPASSPYAQQYGYPQNQAAFGGRQLQAQAPQAVDTTPRCPGCGAPIVKSDAKFCARCGYRF